MKQKQIHIRISWLTTDSISAQKKTWSLPLIASFSNCRPFWTKSKAKSARALRRTVAGRAGPVLIAEDEAPASKQLAVITGAPAPSALAPPPLKQGPAPVAPVRSPGLLSAALSCPAHAETHGSPFSTWQGFQGAGGPDYAVLTAVHHAGLYCAPDELQGNIARGALRTPVRWHASGMSAHSHADVPVLQEWHVARKRPHACGVEGCTAHLVTKRHFEARLCAAHIECHAVLRGGVPRRWCNTCHTYHALEAFSGSLKCAPSLWSPPRLKQLFGQTTSHALCIASCYR